MASRDLTDAFLEKRKAALMRNRSRQQGGATSPSKKMEVLGMLSM